MMRSPSSTSQAAVYEIRFRSLFHPGRGLSFPCDAQGQVCVESMSERARQAYDRARATVGLEYATPDVMLSDLH